MMMTGRKTNTAMASASSPAPKMAAKYANCCPLGMLCETHASELRKHSLRVSVGGQTAQSKVQSHLASSGGIKVRVVVTRVRELGEH